MRRITGFAATAAGAFVGALQARGGGGVGTSIGAGDWGDDRGRAKYPGDGDGSVGASSVGAGSLDSGSLVGGTLGSLGMGSLGGSAGGASARTAASLRSKAQSVKAAMYGQCAGGGGATLTVTRAAPVRPPGPRRAFGGGGGGGGGGLESGPGVWPGSGGDRAYS